VWATEGETRNRWKQADGMGVVAGYRPTTLGATNGPANGKGRERENRGNEREGE